MAETTAVFDINVFDFSFDIIDIIPVVFKVAVEPQFGRIAAGQDVAITLYVIDNMTTPGKRYNFSPGELPQIQFFSPTDVSLGAAVDMQQIATGVYLHRKSVDVSDAKGPYSVVFTAVNGSQAMVTKKMVVFTVI